MRTWMILTDRRGRDLVLVRNAWYTRHLGDTQVCDIFLHPLSYQSQEAPTMRKGERKVSGHNRFSEIDKEVLRVTLIGQISHPLEAAIKPIMTVYCGDGRGRSGLNWTEYPLWFRPESSSLWCPSSGSWSRGIVAVTSSH
ncbi:hypothetical protein RRG08_030878 [Elysia crispata]|uniref:Uncharacterized protein n=1 Tax=Elysia crispata TaxID=231223 RepID=A0AAE0XTB1_9GAST|nr:hypothetical protein RRG08_030878 [Elysia crispata]